MNKNHTKLTEVSKTSVAQQRLAKKRSLCKHNLKKDLIYYLVTDPTKIDRLTKRESWSTLTEDEQNEILEYASNKLQDFVDAL